MSITTKHIREFVLASLPTIPALYLEFFIFHRRFPRLMRPVTFSEKIQHRKLYDRDSRLPELTDKITAKQYVSCVLGSDWTTPTIWHGDALPPLAERAWKIPYVLKASHGSGMNIFIRTENDQNWGHIENQTSHWLKRRYGACTHEWAYSEVSPRLLVEPYLNTGRERLPHDYKFFVFNGKVVYIQVDTERDVIRRQSFYDRHWQRQPFEYTTKGKPAHFQHRRDLPPPKSLDQMIWAAELLGSSFPFVRVDLYELMGKPVFGEMTFYPNAAHYGYRPDSIDFTLGRLW